MKHVMAIGLIGAAMIFSCSKEIIQNEQSRPAQSQPVIESPRPEITPPPPPPAQPDTVAREEAPVRVVVSEPETLTQEQGQLVEVLEIISESDSVNYFYMTRPNDWLSKIALREFGDVRFWKLIYRWNQATLGNNPNLIFPFTEILLRKPIETARPLDYSYYNYKVKANETLWSIAAKEYRNPYAWIVLLRDNATTLGSDLDQIPAGTVIKIRTKLFN